MKKNPGAPSRAPGQGGPPDTPYYNSGLIELPLPPESTDGDRAAFDPRIFEIVQGGPVRLDDLLAEFRRIDWSAVLGQVKVLRRWGWLHVETREGTTWISRGWR